MTLLTMMLIFLLQAVPAFGEDKSPALLPEHALELLMESLADPCAICAEEKKKKAFKIMSRELKPGDHIRITTDCRLIRTENCEENELQISCSGLISPLLFFRFHTAEKHLVGISDRDFTESGVLNAYSRSRTDVFEGELVLVPFKYGDGPTYNFFPSSARLQVHCRILELKRETPGI
jgi:hypothetical protein